MALKSAHYEVAKKSLKGQMFISVHRKFFFLHFKTFLGNWIGAFNYIKSTALMIKYYVHMFIHLFIKKFIMYLEWQ